MEQQRAELRTEKLTCSICLDLLKDPVTTSCGHSYCKTCISNHWDVEEEKDIYTCPECRKVFIGRPGLGKNIMLAELAEELKKSRLQDDVDDQRFAAAEDVACDFCTERKLKAFKSCLNCVASYCEKHLQPHHESAAFQKHKLVDPSKKIMENICSRHDEVMKMFCCTDQQWICILCSTEEHGDHDTISVTATVTEKPRELQESQREASTEVCQTLERADDLPSEPTSRAGFLKYSREITLDPNTACRALTLSEGNRKVTRMEDDPPDHPDRFDDWFQVLSRESLTGRCYWEVEVTCRGGGGVYVAVANKSIGRKGNGDECSFGFNDISWLLRCSPNKYSFYHKDEETPVPGPRSSRIGVYLDHTAGILSFYSVSETMTLFHRVNTTFTEPLLAGFNLYGYYDNGTSAELCKL